MKKHLLSRRKKALISCAALLAILSANLLFSNYGFTRQHVVNETAEYLSTGELQKLMSLDAKALPGNTLTSHGLYYNNAALGHLAMRYSPLMGWFRDGSCFIDLSKPAPTYTGIHTYTDRKSGENYTVLFGCFEDESISSVEFSYATFDEYSAAHRDETQKITISDFMEHDGKIYFVHELIPISGSSAGADYETAAFLDKDGNTLYSTQTSNFTSTTLLS